MVRVKLVGMTYATIKASGVAGAGAGDDAKPDTGKTTKSTTVAGSSNERSLDRVKHCVFQLRMKNAAGKTTGSGSGFLFADGGYGVTNYHVVTGSSSAVAVFADDPGTEHKVELWATQKEMDLALVQIDAPEAELKKRGLIKIGKPPVEGQEVWALGFPMGFGYSVTRGVVNGIRETANMPEYVKKGYPGVKKFVQTDCTINPGNSGGPLIDSSGALVGVNSWVSTLGQNLYFAIYGAEVEVLRPEIKKKAVRFDAVAKDKPDLSQLMAMIPKISVEQTASAEQVRVAGAALANGMAKKCPTCGGDGVMIVKVTVGRTSFNGPRPGSSKEKMHAVQRRRHDPTSDGGREQTRREVLQRARSAQPFRSQGRRRG